MLILIYCYCHKGEIEAQQLYTTDASIPWFAQTSVPKRYSRSVKGGLISQSLFLLKSEP